MAIDIATEYPGKVDTSDPTNYPNGKARNVSAPGDGTGTPWRAPVLNDLIQINYALLAAAGITPSGTADSVTTNQVFEAMQKLNGRQVFTADGTFNTPSWVKRIKVTAVGGGGGGANSTATIGGVGGGGGGTAIAYLDDPAASYSVTVGAGGAGSAASTNGPSSDGGDSVFGSVVGHGGKGADGGDWTGGVGGGATGALVTHYGHTGQGGHASLTRGGMGGGSFFGRGGGGGRNNDQAGSDGVGFGAGGGGGNGTGKGGDGAPGLVIVEWGIGV